MPRSSSTRRILNPNAVLKMQKIRFIRTFFYFYFNFLKKLLSYFRFLVQFWTESVMFLGDFHVIAENACKYSLTFQILDQPS